MPLNVDILKAGKIYADGNEISNPPKLIIDGDENDFYKYGYLGFMFGGNNRLPYSEIIINNIQGTTTLQIIGYFLKNINITNSLITTLVIEAPQLNNLNIPSGLNYFSFYGGSGINNQRFGLITAPDLTPSENTLTEIYLYSTRIQFTDVNYFQINNKANIVRLSLGSSVQTNNTLPIGLFNGLIGLDDTLELTDMNLKNIPIGMFSFLGSGNSNLNLRLDGNQLTESSIDNIITDCLYSATNSGTINIKLDISGGTNAIPSTQALLDIGTLIGTYGWTVNYNT